MTCAARCAALSSSALIRQDILPLTIGYALLMIALATGLLLSRRTTRSAVPGTAPDVDQEQSGAEMAAAEMAAAEVAAAEMAAAEVAAAEVAAAEIAERRPDAVMPGRHAWLRLIRHVGVTFVGGYLLLMIIVIAYYFGVARVTGNFIDSAFTGCAMLLGLSLPVFLAATWLLERRRARATAPSAQADNQRSHPELRESFV